MKYVVVLYDGMADYPVPALGGKTPMMCAKKPNMDYLAKRAEVGLIRTVAQGLKPGSDVANMSVLGFDPMKYYTGRSPLEAASIGIDMKPTDVSLRTNLVTLSEDDLPYEQKTIEDYCADDISTEEAEILIKYIDEKLGTDEFKFYPGVSYRHCLIWDNGTTDLGKMTPPHDITGKVITEYLSTSENAKPLIELMKKSYDLLKDHPVNLARKKAGKRPANSIWLWGEGKRPALSPFEGYPLTGEPNGWVGRMGVVYNENTKKYVLISQYAPGMVYAVSDKPEGPFKIDHIQKTLPIQNDVTGDQTLFQDDDGKAYIICSSANGRAYQYVIPLRESDFLDIEEENIKMLFYDEDGSYIDENGEVDKKDKTGIEGNCMFKYNGNYYYTGSDLYGWNSSRVYVMQSDSILGDYNKDTGLPYIMNNTRRNLLKVPSILYRTAEGYISSWTY